MSANNPNADGTSDVVRLSGPRYAMAAQAKAEAQRRQLIAIEVAGSYYVATGRQVELLKQAPEYRNAFYVILDARGTQN